MATKTITKKTKPSDFPGMDSTVFWTPKKTVLKHKPKNTTPKTAPVTKKKGK